MEDLLMGLFHQAPGLEISTDQFLLRLLVALLAGQAVAWFYSFSHSNLSYSQNYVHSLVLLSMVVSIIMCVVGDSLARAFGLGAALAIVRFRTPIKDARDTAFLFLSVAVGMAAGAGQPIPALVGAVAIGSTAKFLQWTSFGVRSHALGMLRLRAAAKDRGQLEAILNRYCSSYRLTGVRRVPDGAGESGREELVFDVDLRKQNAAQDLVAALSENELASNVTLLPLAQANDA